MGRIRTIKPDFFLDEELAQHNPVTRLLFIGLWTLADCEGRLEDRPKRIAAQLMPYEAKAEQTVDAGLAALALTGQIVRYQVEDRAYVQVVNFRRHQRLSGKEAMADSAFPGPGEATVKQPGSDGESVDAQEGKGKEGKGKEAQGAPAKAKVKKDPIPLTPLKTLEAQTLFAEVWGLWPTTRQDGAGCKGHRLPAERAFQTILDGGGAKAEELRDAAKLYLNHHPNVKAGFIVQIATFYGPEKALWAEAVRTIRDRREREAKKTEGAAQ